MEFSLDIISQNKGVITFLALEATIIIFYWLLNRSISKSQMPIDNQRRLINNSKAILLLLSVIFAVSIWHSEIYTMSISLAAFAAALAIATKELLLCIAGSFYLTGARPFQIGDRVEIDGIRGDVIEVGFLSTQLLEVGPGDLTHQYTGRTLCIPNGKLLSSHVSNETYSNEFVLHVFKIQIKATAEWEFHRDALLESSNEECEQYIKIATRHFEQIARRRHLATPIIEPQVNIKISAPNSLTLVARVAVPARERGRVEQKIVRSYLRKTLKKNVEEKSGS